ncbi:hypothetical protein [Cellulosilyticum ruminicola]|nr:hypothetical protein [Cellulosilyticum ruminicola]
MYWLIQPNGSLIINTLGMAVVKEDSVAHLADLSSEELQVVNQ